MNIPGLGSKKVSQKDMILLCTSLSYMLTAGLTPRDGVDIIMKDPNNKINPAGLKIFIDSLDSGLTIAETFRDNEDVFGSGIWRQVDAAQRTGKVPQCLLRIASQLKNKGDVVGKIRGALVYPCFILVVAVFAAYFLFTGTIPEMGAMMEEFGAELPALTQAMMSISDIVVQYSVFIGIGLVALIVGTSYALKHPLKMKWHRFITKFFLSGSIAINMNYSQVYTLINDMIENGAHTVEALRVAASSVTNVFIMSELMDSASTMEKEGIGLAEALLSSSTMPHDDRLMLNVGSRTGREMEILKDMAERRSVAANEAIARLLEMMTPIIMVLVCAIVGVLVVSIYMPMLTMASAMR